VKKATSSLLVNSFSNWAHQGTTALVAAILMPYCISRLGQDTFGCYVIGMSFIGSLNLMDMGISPSLVRFFSQGLNRKDYRQVAQTFTAAFLVLGLFGLIGSAVCILGEPTLDKYYKVPENLSTDFAYLFYCLGVTFLLHLSNSNPGGLLSGANKYYIKNSVGIFTSIIRLVLVVVAFEFWSPSLTALGVAALASEFLRSVLLLFFSWRITAGHRLISFANLNRKTFVSLGQFSALNFVGTISSIVLLQFPPLVIGIFLNLDTVTAYAPAMLVANAMGLFVSGLCSPLVPIASEEKERGDGGRLSIWSIRIGQINAMVALAAVLPFIIFGHEITSLWLGPDLAWTWQIIAILSFGMTLSLTQSGTYFLALGASSIAPIAWSFLVVAILTLGSISLGMYQFGWGLLEVTICIAVIRLVRSVIYIPWAYSKLFNYHWGVYMWEVFGKIGIIATISGGVFFTAKVLLSNQLENYFVLFSMLIAMELTFAALAYRWGMRKENQYLIKQLFAKIAPWKS
jgi:O-antigen/teichoic acid export membrane protein